DPRFVACLEEARKCKSQFPLNGLNPSVPSEREILVVREKDLTTTLVNSIHDQFGIYNPAVAAGAPQSDPSLHDDSRRSSTDHPAHLKEFKRDELICRHFGPLFSALSTEAGMPNLCVSGDSFQFEREANGTLTQKESPSSQSSSGHMFVVSRL